MGLTDAVKSCLRQYATFTGRARRSEYWYFTLAQALLGLVLGVVFAVVAGIVGVAAGNDTTGGTSAVGGLVIVLFYLLIGAVYLGLLLPALAVNARRLHDTGRSGWWILLSLVPFGSIVLIVFHCLDSIPGPNQFGPNPKGVGGGFAPVGGNGDQFGNQYGNQYGGPQQF